MAGLTFWKVRPAIVVLGEKENSSVSGKELKEMNGLAPVSWTGSSRVVKSIRNP